MSAPWALPSWGSGSRWNNRDCDDQYSVKYIELDLLQLEPVGDPHGGVAGRVEAGRHPPHLVDVPLQVQVGEEWRPALEPQQPVHHIHLREVKVIRFQTG